VLPAVAVSFLSVVVFGFVFIPPSNSFDFDDPGEWLALSVLLVIAIVVSELAARQRREKVEVAQLEKEQTALRRVATLVALGAPPEDVFEAVTREVGQLCGAELARTERYEADGSVSAVAAWSRSEGRLAVGTRFALDGASIAAQVRETGRPARVDSFAGSSGPIAAEARTLGIRSSVGCPILVGGPLWGAIAASTTTEAPFASGTEAQIGEFTGLVGTAIANAESQADLQASRARIAAASDDTRRRIERDLHDGAQRRLVSLALHVRALEDGLSPEFVELRGNLSRVAAALDGVLDELRELARGIHPAILSQGGIAPALKTLARRSAVPVDVVVRAQSRLPQQAEVATYYIVAEALANATAHGKGATRSVESLIAGSDQWNSEPSVHEARSGIGASTTASGRMCTGGGEVPGKPDTVPTIECFSRGRWRRVATMEVPRHGLAVVAEGNRVHFVAGGPQPGATYSDAHEVLTV
jgi:signal transduction histidine kinase